MDFSLAETDSGPLCTSVFYCGFFTVGSCRIYVIMVIGADDSVIIITVAEAIAVATHFLLT